MGGGAQCGTQATRKPPCSRSEGKAEKLSVRSLHAPEGLGLVSRASVTCAVLASWLGFSYKPERW